MFGPGTSSGYVEELPSGGDDAEEPGVGGTDTLDMEQLAELANEAFANAVAAQQNGDWTAYGQYLEQLAEYLAQMVTDTSAAETDTLDAVPIQ